MKNFYQCAFYALLGIIIGFSVATMIFYKPATTEVKIQTQPIESVISDGDSLTVLNEANLMKELIRQEIKHPEIVLAQAKWETGYFRSSLCRKNNNLFGLRHKDGYYKFSSWQASVTAYRDYVQYRYRGGDYFNFLQKIGYAEDPNYIKHIKHILQEC